MGMAKEISALVWQILSSEWTGLVGYGPSSLFLAHHAVTIV